MGFGDLQLITTVKTSPFVFCITYYYCRFLLIKEGLVFVYSILNLTDGWPDQEGV